METDREGCTVHRSEKSATQEAFPWILCIVSFASIEENWPMIARDCQVSCAQLSFDADWENKVSTSTKGTQGYKRRRTRDHSN